MNAAIKTYETRRSQSHDCAERMQRRHDHLANVRLAVFVLGVGVFLFALWRAPVFAGLWLAAATLVFVALVLVHAKTLATRERASTLAAFYESGLARMNGTWHGTGPTGTALAPEEHPYAHDLDLFGESSLFQLLCTARTSAGEAMLARWMTAPVTAEELIERQEAVRELRGNLDLRDDLALQGRDVRAKVHPEILTAWGAAPPRLSGGPLLTAARVLTLANVLLTGLAIASGLLSLVFLGVVLSLGLMAFRRRELQAIRRGIEEPAREVRALAAVMARFEKESFKSPRLCRLRQRLFDRGEPASRSLAKLGRLIHFLELQANQLFLPVAILVLWPLHASWALERWRARHGGHIADWLEALGELEALCAAACYAYEHPDDPWPEVLSEGRRFEARGLGHPLIPTATRVRNDVSIAPPLQMLVVSGSNMSGKSTLLRSIGINMVLTHLGAPVCAEKLATAPFHLGATIFVHDSIQTGTSRFYAEIQRLKQFTDKAAEEVPFLFLCDEILHGTNSHDRAAGTAALVRALLDAGTIGLITTHDLAITQDVAQLAPRAKNVHFTSEFTDGELRFDYHLRQGVVRETNAILLMRQIGLPV